MAPKRPRTDKTSKDVPVALEDKPTADLKPHEAKKLLAQSSDEHIAESAFASRYLSEPVPKEKWAPSHVHHAAGVLGHSEPACTLHMPGPCLCCALCGSASCSAGLCINTHKCCCRFPPREMPANVAYQLIKDHRQLDANPRLNLAR